jgi:hypothetical protein
MMRLAFVIGLLAISLTSATPVRADFAVVTFNSGYCRVWTETAFGPQDGHYLWFPSPIGWHFRFLTWEGADLAMHRAVAWNRCHHWW